MHICIYIHRVLVKGSVGITHWSGVRSCTGQGLRKGSRTGQGSGRVLVRGPVGVSYWSGVVFILYIHVYTHTYKHTHTHTHTGFFSIFRGYVWYDTDSDVYLTSSILRFGLGDVPTSLDFNSSYIFSQTSTD
jgi:hypothetical protein